MNSMCYKDDNHCVDSAYGLLTFFFAYDAILFGPCKWIIEDVDCFLKAGTVFLLIGEVFLFIPVNSKYTSVVTIMQLQYFGA